MNFHLFHEADYIFWIVVIVGFSLLYFIYQLIIKKSWYKKLIVLRVVLLSFFVFLLLNPLIMINSENKINLNWAIFVDNSASIKNHKTPSLNAIKAGLIEVSEKLNQRKIPYKLYSFDESINIINSKDIDSLRGSGMTTNLSKVLQLIRKNENQFAGAIIISDGIITEGAKPTKQTLNLNLPIHTIGVGQITKLVDVSIQSIDVPTVVLKNNGVNVHALIQSIGNVDERLSVSIYNGKKLLGSKYVRVNGNSSKKDVYFRFQPEKIGQQKYQVRVSSIKDEVNILNNRQNFSILVIKNKYKVALITGSPNKNTNVIKRVLIANERIELDHFVKMNDSKFKPEIKNFWSKPYELIIFENYPIKPLSSNFIRILGKKILTHKSGIMLVVGPNQTSNSLNGITSIFGAEFSDSPSYLEPNFWNFIGPNISFDLDLPPLREKFIIQGKGHYSDSLAIFDSGSPLWMQNQIGDIRTTIFNSTDIYSLFFYKNKALKSNLLTTILDQSSRWLLKSDGANEKFFRLNKDRYQQGEMIYLTGTQPFKTTKNDQSINIKVSNEISNLISREITFNVESNRWEGKFRALSEGNYIYKVYMDINEIPIQIGNFEVIESQIELSNVYLNQKLLKSMAKESNGKYFYWDEREELFDELTKKVKSESKENVIKFNENKIILLFLILLLSVEWITRRIKGLS